MTSISLSPLESIEGLIWLNGQFVKWQDARIHVLTHSLHYGGSVFEGEKSYNGKIFKIREHTERLFHSANLMKLEIPFSVDEVIEASHELLKKNHLLNAYIRPMAWRSTEALMVKPYNETTHLMIAAWEPRKKINNEPLKLSISKWRKASDDVIPAQCKSSSQYAMYAVAVIEANEAGFDDALLLDKFGYIAECTTSNIFFAKENTLITPKTSFCLNGITRQTIIALARQEGIPILEEDITLHQLPTFLDCFVTGTAAGLKNVASINFDNQISNYTQSEFFNILNIKYNNLVKAI